MNARNVRLAEYSVEHAQRRVEGTAKELEDLLRETAHRLLRTADRLADDGAEASFNSLGEIQGRGAEIDRLCGLLRERRENAQMLAGLVRDLVADAAQEG